MAAEIRPARPTDVEALSAIETAVFSADRISKASFRRLAASHSASLLAAESHGAIVGYLVVLFRTGSDKARLYSIAAAPGQAHAGLGRALLAAAEHEAMRRGGSALRLEVRQDNPRAISLYEKNGYRALGAIAGYYADGMTALRFEKALGRIRAGARPEATRLGTALS